MKTYPLLSSALLLASANIYADSACTAPNECVEACPSPCASVLLSTPVHSFEIHAEALYLQPTGSNLHYAAEAIPLPLPSPSWKIHGIDTDYHFGFDVGIRGIFHCANAHLTLDWTHFRSSDSASKQVSSSNMIGPFFEIGPDASAYKKAHGKATFHFDEVDLDYGVFVNIGDRLETNFYSGIGFTCIKQSLHSKFSNFEGTIVRTIKVPSTFSGAGPQLGMNFSYRIANGFHFTGGTTGSLFVGPQKNHTSYEALSPALAPLGITPPNQQSTHVRKKTQVVPGFEGKLGLAYSYVFCNDSMINIEVGYDARVYINAIQSIDIGSEVNTPPVVPDIIGVFARTFRGTLSNFALAGPYLAFDVGF